MICEWGSGLWTEVWSASEVKQKINKYTNNNNNNKVFVSKFRVNYGFLTN